MGPEQRVGLGRSKARYQPATNFLAAWHGVFKKLIQEHLSPAPAPEPAGADARMIIKQAASGIPVFLLLFSLNRIQDRGPFTRSRSHALKSIGHSAATAVGPNYRPTIIRKISSLGLPWCGIAWRNRDMPWHSLPFRPAYRSFPHMRRKSPHIFYRLEHDGWNCSA